MFLQEDYTCLKNNYISALKTLSGFLETVSYDDLAKNETYKTFNVLRSELVNAHANFTQFIISERGSTIHQSNNIERVRRINK